LAEKLAENTRRVRPKFEQRGSCSRGETAKGPCPGAEMKNRS